MAMAEVNANRIPRQLDQVKDDHSEAVISMQKLLQDVIKQNEQLNILNNLLKEENETVKQELRVEKVETAKKAGTIANFERRLIANKLPVLDALLEGEQHAENLTPETLKTILRDNVKMKDTLSRMENSASVQRLVQEVYGLRSYIKNLQEKLVQVESEREVAMETLKNSESQNQKQIRALLIETRRVQTLETHQANLCRSWDLQQDHVGEEARQLKSHLRSTVDACTRLGTLLGPGTGDARELKALRVRVPELEKVLLERDQSILTMKETYHIVLRYNQQWQAYNEQREQYVAQLNLRQEQFARAALKKLQELQVERHTCVAPQDGGALELTSSPTSAESSFPAIAGTSRSIPTTLPSPGTFGAAMTSSAGHSPALATCSQPSSGHTPSSSRFAPLSPVSEPVARNATAHLPIGSPYQDVVDTYKRKLEEEAQTKSQLQEQLVDSETRVTSLSNEMKGLHIQLQAVASGGSQGLLADLQRQLSESREQVQQAETRVCELSDELGVTNALLEQKQVSAMARLHTKRRHQLPDDVMQSCEDEVDSSLALNSGEGLDTS